MHVAICTPCHDARVHEAHARSVDTAWRHLEAKGFTVTRLVVSGVSVLPRARNILVAEALQRKADRIIFMDSDIAAGPDVFEAILKHQQPIVGVPGSTRPGVHGEKPQVIWSPFLESRAVQPDGLIECRRHGTGFLSIAREVFETLHKSKLSKPYIIRNMDPKFWPFLAAHFAYGLSPLSDYPQPGLADKLKIRGIPEDQWFEDEGEDYFFCRNTAEAGFKIWADVRLRIRHYEGRSYSDYCLGDMLMARK